MAAKSDYGELVSQAERAVSSVKDPELKRAAFEKVLEDLLANRAQSDGPVRAAKRPAKAQKSAHSSKPRGGPQAYVEEMVEDGFFKKPKTLAQVKAELENRGHHIPTTSLSGPLQKLCQRRMLRRHRTNTEGAKQTFNYSNW